jgi:basic membrane protein A
MRLRASAALVAALTLALALAGCSSSGGDDGGGADEGAGASETGAAGEASGEPVPEGETLTVGWILPGAADETAVSAVEQAFPDRIESVTASDAADPAAAASDLVAQGARLVISAVPGACAAIPETHCAEPGAGEPGPAAFVLGDGWWNRAYLVGRAAGLLTETDSVGYVAAADTPQETAAVNAFALGCQSGNPNCVVRLVVAPPNPTRAVGRLGRQGADLIATTVLDPALCDAPAQILAVQPVLAPGDLCGSAVVSTNLAAVAEPLVQGELDGTFPAGSAGALPLDQWADSVAQDVQTKVDDRAAEIEGGLNVFTGPLFDNEGQQQVAEGEELTPEFVTTQWTWLLGGVLTG